MKNKKLSAQEKSIFCGEVSIILSSGISINEGLEIISAESENEQLREVRHFILSYYKEKGNFYKAVKASDKFDPYMEEMIQVGEVSGNLDDVMMQLTLYYERLDDMKSQIKDALTYPFILMSMMLVVIGILVMKILPIFQNVLNHLGTSLSPFAQSLMNFAHNFAFISFGLLCLLVIVIIGIFIYTKVSSTKPLQERLLSKLFITKVFYRKVALVNITYALSLFLSSGYPIEEAVKYLPGFVTHTQLKSKVNQIIEAMKNGTSFWDALKMFPLYDGIYANMIQLGFRSGKQDDVLKKLVVLYEKEVNDSISRFLNIIEPTIVAVLSLIVGIILLSVMLPLMSVMSSLG